METSFNNQPNRAEEQKVSTLNVTSYSAPASTLFREVGEICSGLRNKLWETRADSHSAPSRGVLMNLNASSIRTLTSTHLLCGRFLAEYSERWYTSPLIHKHCDVFFT
ncbi:hypothetical protein ILYODFUR_039216 [Ilyodon furcidens]|uniref:Uncharacterized protein n=1 Tax=Ilyodon furcidens TaxID=33524 RepID=A0ABV0UP55_9TELE